ncbi:hypothetical protein BJV74DRAFT_967703 [Russula compacta]|nr:hypothetical protein BJV74DRAFT_967703 [Russula compacta]
MQECQHPANSQADCRIDNPCNFNCTAPFVQEDDRCVCKHPYHLCNGVCTAADQACSSAPADRRNINPNLRARTHGIYAQREAQGTCAFGEKVCGVNQGSNAFECLNTDTALESCGGCVTANPFLPASEQTLDGVDCTTIPNVKNVKCSGGHCIVESCTGLYVPSSDQGACVPTPSRLFV